MKMKEGNLVEKREKTLIRLSDLCMGLSFLHQSAGSLRLGPNEKGGGLVCLLVPAVDSLLPPVL